MRANDPLQNPFYLNVVNFFSSPKVPKAPDQQQMPTPPAPVVVPPPPKPLPPPPPPPTTSLLEVAQAQDDQRAQALSRKGIRSTMVAGNTGGYQPTAPASPA